VSEDQAFFRGRRALITGASSGIGRALALELARRGAETLLVARRVDRLEALAAEIEAEGGPRARPLGADLLDSRDRDALLRLLGDPAQSPEILVNNAAFGVNDRFLDVEAERLERCIRLGFEVPTLLTRRWLDVARSRDEGALLNVASIAAFVPTPWHGVYSATKASLASWTEALALELEGEGIRASVVCPGVTDTEFFAAGEYEEGNLVGRMPRMSPEDVARDALDSLARGRPLRVAGWSNRALIALTKCLPGRLVTKLAGGTMRR
jgi:uncharacterized protein